MTGGALLRVCCYSLLLKQVVGRALQEIVLALLQTKDSARRDTTWKCEVFSVHIGWLTLNGIENATSGLPGTRRA